VPAPSRPLARGLLRRDYCGVTDPAFPSIRSDVPGIVWPPVSRGQAAVLAALMRQLDDTQWMDAASLTALQFRQLGQVAAHCDRHSPHFHERLRSAGLGPQDLLSPEGLRRLPVLTRRELQTAENVFCAELPTGHTPVFEARTSGSTGEPVVVRRTSMSQLDWLAVTLREHLWHKRDFRGRLCAIRANISAPGRLANWGPPASLIFETGPSLGIPISTDIASQVRLIAEFAPDNLLVYPNNLKAIMEECAARGISLPSLRHVRMIGETLSPQLREDAAAFFHARVADCYSSQEIGYLACECPDSLLYHVMSETVIVEILNDEGAPCREGQAGRVVVTDLHNFATPLIRYDIGDYAEPGPPCPCGRGLPTLKRILGRERNLILMPDGTRHWPLVGYARYRELAPIIQFQLVQEDRDTVTVRLVTERSLNSGEEDALRAHIQASLGFAFSLRFVYFDGRIPRGPTGKFEEFICAVR
jgi:phenylacetate-CoA ligase